jgi:hypothetical protein
MTADEVFQLPRQFIGDGTFLLQVFGDSMVSAGISDGDWVFVARQQDARPGEIVAAMIDGDATVCYAPVPGLKPFQVVITYGLTDDTLAARLVYERLMPITGVRRDPEAANA